MINGVFIINNQGKPRLSKFYEYLVRLPILRCADLLQAVRSDTTPLRCCPAVRTMPSNSGTCTRCSRSSPSVTTSSATL